jgi:hypothetical protein
MACASARASPFIRPAGAAEAKARRPAFTADEKPADLAWPVIIAVAPTSARRAASGTSMMIVAQVVPSIPDVISAQAVDHRHLA